MYICICIRVCIYIYVYICVCVSLTQLVFFAWNTPSAFLVCFPSRNYWVSGWWIFVEVHGSHQFILNSFENSRPQQLIDLRTWCSCRPNESPRLRTATWKRKTNHVKACQTYIGFKDVESPENGLMKSRESTFDSRPNIKFGLAASLVLSLVTLLFLHPTLHILHAELSWFMNRIKCIKSQDHPYPVTPTPFELILRCLHALWCTLLRLEQWKLDPREQKDSRRHHAMDMLWHVQCEWSKHIETTQQACQDLPGLRMGRSQDGCEGMRKHMKTS